MTYQPLHHKYRPQTFGDLVGQEAIATTLTNALHQQRIAPAYLFTGARGTGKTSSARILAKSLNCLAYEVPTAQPCGVCEVCQSIARGSALDVIEIDAASNTGVDNMRELIERSQFAPVQCRYKVYVVDECLTGDSLIWTDQGCLRIDDPTLLGKNVLSYNDALAQWELKPVRRWLDQGIRQTYRIKTSTQELRCTGNHLIRAEQGWIAARDVKEGAKILSPVNVGAAPSLTNLAQMGVCVASSEGISLRETPTGKKATTSTPFLTKLNRFVRSAYVDAVNSLKYLTSCEKRATASTVFCPAGKSTRSNPNTAFGRQEPKPLSPSSVAYRPTVWDSFTAPCWATAPLPIQTNTAAFPGYLGRTERFSESGWSTKQPVYRRYAPSSGLLPIKALGTNQFVATQPAILNSSKCLHGSSPKERKNESPWTGSVALRLKGLPGGTWMMDHLASALRGVQAFNFIPKGILPKRTNLSLAGSPQGDIQRKYNTTEVLAEAKITTLFRSGQMLLENFWTTCSPTLFQQWHTNLEVVESVRLAGVEHVYDIEVEDNHNFVANGLLVHNCHMLSTAAFNALLKTLEEPPDRVVFVLATTDPQRVLPTIISRCQRFDFRRIPLEASVGHLRSIATKEAIAVTDDAITLIAQMSQGGMRDAESLLDQLSLLPDEVTVDHVWNLVGSVPERDLMALLEAIAQDTPETLLDSVRRLMDRGREPLIVLQNLASFYRDLLIAKTAPARNDLVALTPPTWEALCCFAQTMAIQTILAGQQQLRSSEDQLKNTTQPRLWLEVTLMGLLPSAGRGERRGERSEGRGERDQAGSSAKVADGGAALPPARPSMSATLPSQAETIAPTIPAIPAEADAIVKSPPVARAVQATAPAPNMTSQAAAANSSLSDTWQQILSHIDLPPTRGMLSANCYLFSQNEQDIVIGVKSSGMLKMINGMLPQLTKASAKAFQAKVNVVLQVVDATPPATQTKHLPEPDHLPSATDPSRNDRSERAYPAPGTPADRPTSAQEASAGQPSSFAQQDQQARTHAPFNASPTPPLATHAAEGSVQDTGLNVDRWQQEDEVTLAARQLADFFGGKVVDMSDGDTVTETPQLADIDATSLQAKAAALPEPEDDPDSDDDVPF